MKAYQVGHFLQDFTCEVCFSFVAYFLLPLVLDFVLGRKGMVLNLRLISGPSEEGPAECKLLTDAELKPEPTLPCKVCNKLFGSRQTLLRHSMVHTGKKPYGCPMCSARFRCTSHLKRHERQHTGERPCRCPLCPKAYTDNPNLLRHMTLVHGSRAYACRLCPSTYALERELQSHIIAEHRNTISNLAEDASAAPQPTPDGGHALALVRRLCRPEDPGATEGDEDPAVASSKDVSSLLPLRRGRGRPKGAKNAPRARPALYVKPLPSVDVGDDVNGPAVNMAAGDDIPTIDVSVRVDAEVSMSTPCGPARAPSSFVAPPAAATYSRDVACQVTPPASPVNVPSDAADPAPHSACPGGAPVLFSAPAGQMPVPQMPGPVPQMPVPQMPGPQMPGPQMPMPGAQMPAPQMPGPPMPGQMPAWPPQMGYFPYGPMMADPAMAQLLQSQWALMSHYASLRDMGMMAYLGNPGHARFPPPSTPPGAPAGPWRPSDGAPPNVWPHDGK